MNGALFITKTLAPMPNRVRLVVEVNLDPVPGQLHTAEDSKQVLQHLLSQAYPWYFPLVVSVESAETDFTPYYQEGQTCPSPYDKCGWLVSPTGRTRKAFCDDHYGAVMHDLEAMKEFPDVAQAPPPC